MARKKTKSTFSWMNPKLEVREAGNFGKGVFAKKNIKKDERLAIFGGYIISREDEDNLPLKMRDFCLQISENHVIGPIKEGQIDDACYFNHCCDPNAGIKGQIFLVAIRNIKKGEYVTFDYGMVLHNSSNVKKQYRLKCECGSSICRKVVTVNDWKKKELQKKYNGYFQFYIQEKINNLKNENDF